MVDEMPSAGGGGRFRSAPTVACAGARFEDMVIVANVRNRRPKAIVNQRASADYDRPDAASTLPPEGTRWGGYRRARRRRVARTDNMDICHRRGSI